MRDKEAKPASANDLGSDATRHHGSVDAVNVYRPPTLCQLGHLTILDENRAAVRKELCRYGLLGPLVLRACLWNLHCERTSTHYDYTY